MLDGTRNADLLCSYRGRARLIEVKSAARSPGERLYDDLLRHLREWPGIPNATAVDGGALILNHEQGRAPLDRSPEPDSRPEFLAGQTEPILTTWQLFEAWRDEAAHRASLDMPAVRGVIERGLPLIAERDGAKLEPVGGIGLD